MHSCSEQCLWGGRSTSQRVEMVHTCEFEIDWRGDNDIIKHNRSIHVMCCINAKYYYMYLIIIFNVYQSQYHRQYIQQWDDRHWLINLFCAKSSELDGRQESAKHRSRKENGEGGLTADDALPPQVAARSVSYLGFQRRDCDLKKTPLMSCTKHLFRKYLIFF